MPIPLHIIAAEKYLVPLSINSGAAKSEQPAKQKTTDMMSVVLYFFFHCNLILMILQSFY